MKVDKNRYFVMGVKNIKSLYQILGRGCFVGEGGRKMCSFQSKINVILVQKASDLCFGEPNKNEVKTVYQRTNLFYLQT